MSTENDSRRASTSRSGGPGTSSPSPFTPSSVPVGLHRWEQIAAEVAYTLAYDLHTRLDYFDADKVLIPTDAREDDPTKVDHRKRFLRLFASERAFVVRVWEAVAEREFDRIAALLAPPLHRLEAFRAYRDPRGHALPAKDLNKLFQLAHLARACPGTPFLVVDDRDYAGLLQRTGGITGVHLSVEERAHY